MFLMLYEYSPHSHTLGIIVKQLHRCIIAKSMHAGNFCVKVPALDTDFNFIHKIRIILLGPLLASFMFTELLYIAAHYLFPFCNLSLLATTPSLFHPWSLTWISIKLLSSFSVNILSSQYLLIHYSL